MKRNIALLCSVLSIAAISVQAQSTGGSGASGGASGGTAAPGGALGGTTSGGSSSTTTRGAQGTAIQNHPNAQNLPPGLQRQGQLPPGLSQRDQLPPGLQRGAATTPNTVPGTIVRQGTAGSLQPVPGALPPGTISNQPFGTQYALTNSASQMVSNRMAAVTNAPGLVTPGTTISQSSTVRRPDQQVGLTNVIYFGNTNTLTPTGRDQGLAPGRQGLTPGQQGLTPGQQGTTPGQQGLAPGQRQQAIRPQVLQTNGSPSLR